MTNKEAAEEIQKAIDLIRQDGKDWLDERDIPILEMAINALRAQELSNNSPELDNNFGDLIRRQEAIDALKHDAKVLGIEPYDQGYTPFDAIITIHGIPNAQPETHEERTETHACDLISRQAAMEEISKQQTYKMFEGEDTLYLDANDVGSVLASLPSAQPEQTNSWYINSWCIDCKEYDTENKCCPRYNRVIKQTLDEAYRHGETEAEARFHSEIVRCKYCKHFEYDHPYIIQGVPVLGHEVCNAWGNGCKTDENGYCFLAERRTDE